jgi:hypothetical protein
METTAIQSVVQLNECNKQFWLEQLELFSQQFSIETVRTRAIAVLKWEELRGVPLKNRQTLESAADDAYQEESRFRREFSRKGGRAVKEDFLNRLIHKLVLKQPSLTERQLFHKLRKLESEGNVQLAPDEVTFDFCDDNEKWKTALVTGLKDRLFRAKRKINSR